MYDIVRTDITTDETVTMVIGMRCTSPIGFLFLWTNILSFLFATRKARGCAGVVAGVCSPLSVVMVSYWTAEADLMAFVGHPKHKTWMRFVRRHPRSLSLFNEIYNHPARANHIGEARGYAATSVDSRRKTA